MLAPHRVGLALAAVAGAASVIWLAHGRAARHGGDDDTSLGDVITGRAEARRAQRAAEAQALTARAEADRARKRTALPSMLGARPGQPGPLFDGVHFDHDEPVPAEARARLDAFDDAAGAEIGMFKNSTPGVTVHFASDLDVAEAIASAWGAAPAGGDWIDRPDRLIAHLDRRGGAATLSWRAFETADDLIRPRDPDRFGFEPAPLYGATADAVRAIAHAGDLVDDHSITVALPPLEHSEVPVEVVFELAGGKVTGYTIHTQSPDDASEIDYDLFDKLGDPPGGTDNGRYVFWHRRGTLVHETSDPDDGITIEVSRDPR